MSPGVACYVSTCGIKVVNELDFSILSTQTALYYKPHSVTHSDLSTSGIFTHTALGSRPFNPLYLLSHSHPKESTFVLTKSCARLRPCGLMSTVGASLLLWFLPLFGVCMRHITNGGQDRLYGGIAENWLKTVNKWTRKCLKEKENTNTVHLLVHRLSDHFRLA